MPLDELKLSIVFMRIRIVFMRIRIVFKRICQEIKLFFIVFTVLSLHHKIFSPHKLQLGKIITLKEFP